MAPTRTSHDVVIVGGGPAGSAAASAAGRRKLRTVVIEGDGAPRPSACAGWLGPAATKLCRACGVEAETVGVAFAGLRLRSRDLKQCVEVKDRELKGVAVQAAALSAALLKAVEVAGTDVWRRVRVAELHLGETCATLKLSDGRQLETQVVLIADGAAAPTAALARLPAARQMPTVVACALAVFSTKKPGAGLDVILGAGRGVKLATIARGRSEIRVTLLSRDDPTPVTAQLGALIDSAKAAGVLPAEFDAPPRPQPGLAGIALDMETHVGKRCLLVGDAGGFVSAFSGEGLYPAMRSGTLAAETVARALRAPVLQDELASFDATWRADLADYLRMPNTDLGLLMPMVFGNAQMSKRVARAFLLGQPF